MTDSDNDTDQPPAVSVGMKDGDEDEEVPAPRQKKGRGRPTAEREWDELEGCWTNTSTGKREAAFKVGDDVSALWPGNRKTAPGFYDAKVVRIDLVGLRAMVDWADGATGCAVPLVQVCPYSSNVSLVRPYSWCAVL